MKGSEERSRAPFRGLGLQGLGFRIRLRAPFEGSFLRLRAERFRIRLRDPFKGALLWALCEVWGSECASGLG